jgi:hypothetical protein
MEHKKIPAARVHFDGDKPPVLDGVCPWCATPRPRLILMAQGWRVGRRGSRYGSRHWRTWRVTCCGRGVRDAGPWRENADQLKLW